MKNKIITAVLILAAAFAACKKKPPETVPVPKAAQPPPTTVGTYFKNTVGQVQKARDAKALTEKTEKANVDGTD